ITKSEEMLCVFERRNFVGKNGIYDIRCHQLHGPTFPWFLGVCRSGVVCGGLPILIWKSAEE
ncbi:hypothetical protein NEUTE1DRAFT_34252, partial [Neurospora tetrasperma FGSC 2508]